MHYLKCALFAILLCQAAAWSDERSFPSIDQLMSPEEFEAAGLHKLNRDERSALEAWLVRYTAVDAEKISRSSKEVKAVVDSRLRGNLVGEFTGWSGKTVFYLDNGERWRQVGQARYYPRKKLMSPAVVIHRAILGGYSLELMATGARVRVRQIK